MGIEPGTFGMQSMYSTTKPQSLPSKSCQFKGLDETGSPLAGSIQEPPPPLFRALNHPGLLAQF